MFLSLSPSVSKKLKKQNKKLPVQSLWVGAGQTEMRKGLCPGMPSDGGDCHTTSRREAHTTSNKVQGGPAKSTCLSRGAQLMGQSHALIQPGDQVVGRPAWSSSFERPVI